MNKVLFALGLAMITAISAADLASAQQVSIPVEKGPDGQVNANVGVNGNTGHPTSIGGSFNTSSGNSGGASISTGGDISISGGSNGVTGTITTGPNGTSGSVGYQRTF